MEKQLLFLGTLLGVPLFAFWVANSFHGEYGSNWNSMYRYMVVVKWAALGTGALGLLLTGFIAFAGYIVRSSRSLLLALFQPGLALTILALMVLVILHAALAMVSIYFVMLSISTDQSVPTGLFAYLIAMVVVGAIIGIGTLIRNSFSIVKRASTVVVGKRISWSKHPTLRQFVFDLSNKIGAPLPQHIVAGLNLTFFVTEADVYCIDGKLTGKTMYLSLPFCRILTKDEFKAVIGHELSHFKGMDTQFSQKFYPIYRGTTDSINSMQEEMEGVKKIALLPVLYIISYFLESFSVAERRISRERELAADRFAAKSAGSRSLGTALIKVHAFSDYWKWLRRAMQEALAERKIYTNVSSLFAEVVKKNSQPEAFEGLEVHRLTHPTDSHPPLSIRLQALGLSIPALTDTALNTSPEFPAISLFTSYDEIEKELSETEHALMIELGEARIGRSVENHNEPEQQNFPPKECPVCAMFTHVDAVRCQCGYDFTNESN